MARKPKPDAIKKAKGTYRKDRATPAMARFKTISCSVIFKIICSSNHIKLQ